MGNRIWVPAKPEDDFDILVQSKDHGGQHIAVVEREVDYEAAEDAYLEWEGHFHSEGLCAAVDAAYGLGGDG